MCDHEGRDCPGRSCGCECMNCQFDNEVNLVFAEYMSGDTDIFDPNSLSYEGKIGVMLEYFTYTREEAVAMLADLGYTE